jgi:membrane protease YdiL (CAAX protease family)
MAFVWLLLAFACSAFLGFLVGLIGSLYGVRPALYLAVSAEVGFLAFSGMLLAAAWVQGGIVGSGQARLGLANVPVSNMPVIALLVGIAAAYAVILHVAFPASDADSNIRSATTALTIYYFFRAGLLAPVAEECLLRGWLWTGLQRQWGVLPAAMLTSVLFVALHVGYAATWLIAGVPLVVLLALARHFGRSVRAPIALHIVYNTVAMIAARWH